MLRQSILDRYLQGLLQCLRLVNKDAVGHTLMDLIRTRISHNLLHVMVGTTTVGKYIDTIEDAVIEEIPVIDKNKKGRALSLDLALLDHTTIRPETKFVELFPRRLGLICSLFDLRFAWKKVMHKMHKGVVDVS